MFFQIMIVVALLMQSCCTPTLLDVQPLSDGANDQMSYLGTAITTQLLKESQKERCCKNIQQAGLIRTYDLLIARSVLYR